jgi:hypothetical protein
MNLTRFSRWNGLSRNPLHRISTLGTIRLHPSSSYTRWRCCPTCSRSSLGLRLDLSDIWRHCGGSFFLTTGLFCWGLLQLPRRPVLAGILFGVLTFKPHLGLLLPVALVAGGHWRTVVAAALTAVLSAAASLVLFGTGVWSDFLASTSETRSMLESGMNFGHYYKMQSVFAAARLLGSPMLVAYTLQALVALAAAAAVAWIWRRPAADPDMKNAALMAATPLSTAFIFDYDLMLLAPAIAWLARGLDSAVRAHHPCGCFSGAVCLACRGHAHAPARRTDFHRGFARGDPSTQSCWKRVREARFTKQ